VCIYNDENKKRQQRLWKRKNNKSTFSKFLGFVEFFTFYKASLKEMDLSNMRRKNNEEDCNNSKRIAMQCVKER
jgi:hypothetical protein